jgi:hypothetical protein
MRAWFTVLATLNVAVANWAAWTLDKRHRRVVLLLSAFALALALLGISITERGT